MKKITLWCEGYVATGNRSDALFCGTYKAKDLKDAIRQYRDTLEDHQSKSCIDIERETFWGCRFFNNERDARKSFG